MRIARRTAGLLIALAIATTVSACTPEPAPTPTPTGFASEDEAFRAAEETYRAYVDALNARLELAESRHVRTRLCWTTGDA